MPIMYSACVRENERERERESDQPFSLLQLSFSLFLSTDWGRKEMGCERCQICLSFFVASSLLIHTDQLVCVDQTVEEIALEGKGDGSVCR